MTLREEPFIRSSTWLAVRGKGHLLVGSNNLTGGGLFFNYEAGLACTLNPTVAGDRRVLDQIDEHVRALRADPAVCVRLTARRVAQLARGRKLEDERRSSREHADADRLRKRSRSTGLFSKSEFEKHGAPPYTPRDPGKRASQSARGTPRRSRSFRAQHLRPGSWWKRLGPGDAQHPPRGNPTGVIRVTRLQGLPSDIDAYFRRRLFDLVRWRRARDSHGNRILLANVTFDVTVGQRHLGPMLLQLDYGAHRGERARSKTLIHLGPLAPLFRQRDYTGWFLIVERTGSTNYSLRVTRRQPR